MNTAHLTTNWKSTSIGFCILAMTALQSVKFDASGHFSMTPRDWVGVAIGIAAAAIGTIQKDAGTVTAVTSDGIQAVPSHEVPDNPKAKVVKSTDA